MLWLIFPEVKRPGPEVDSSPLSSTKVNGGGGGGRSVGIVRLRTKATEFIFLFF
jgi:hypothetical protein